MLKPKLVKINQNENKNSFGGGIWAWANAFAGGILGALVGSTIIHKI
jgi:hypothetical protein